MAIGRPGPSLDKALAIAYLFGYTTFATFDGDTVRILAVEDEPEYLEMLQEVMQSIGHSIIVAENGVEALQMLERQHIDVIVSDVKMPVMDGVEFHEKVRAQPSHRNTPFIFLTGVNDLSRVRAVCKADSDLLLQKPFPVDSLLRLFSGKIR